MHYSVCPKCKAHKDYPEGKSYVCKNCHEIVQVKLNGFSTNIETLRPVMREHNYMLLPVILIGILSIYWSLNLNLSRSDSRELFIGTIVPPLLLIQLYSMSKHKVLIWYNKIVYRATKPKLYNFFKWLYLISCLLIIVFITFPLIRYT